ncbi:MAG TPA: NAD(P)/FAD-dependent oxidoreductase [bacterium]|nr:NAD(P)/FAD-dependent oxidoreductase [bacterium]
MNADVIVVGAGPAGSSATAILASRGIRVLLLDRATFPRDKPCGDYCNPGAVRLLRQLGSFPVLPTTEAAPISELSVYAQDGSRFSGAFPDGPGLLVPRLRLDAALLACAARAGAIVYEGVGVDAVRFRTDAVEVRTVSDRWLSARLLIAADGAHSAIARSLGRLTVPARGRYTVGAYFSGLPRTAPKGELHLGPDLYCGVAHFGGGAANVCMALPRQQWRRGGPQQVFDAALRTLPVLADMMASARRESAFRCFGPVGFAAREAVASRVLFIGDAAGHLEPITGQGIFLALHSAILAADVASEALGANDFSHRRLSVYARRRGRDIAGKVLASRLLQHLAFHRHLTPVLVRRLNRHAHLASELVGVTGDVLPPTGILSPAYLARLLL